MQDLDGSGIPYLFEPAKLSYTVPARSATYLPDFILRFDKGLISPPSPDCFTDEQWWKEHFVVETKGRFMTEDRQKHVLIKKQLPFSDIRFVFTRAQSPIRKNSPTSYAKWCEKNGFLYNDKVVPNEWFTS